MPFDADAFMNQTVDAPLETEVTLCPPGEYSAMIGDFTREAFEEIEFDYKRGPKAGTRGSMTKFNCPFVISSEPKLVPVLGRDHTTVSKQMILDIDETSGSILHGVNKNIELGRIRDAVGQNQPGPWQIGQLRNAGPVMIKVVHRDYQRKDGSTGKMAEVERVVRIA